MAEGVFDQKPDDCPHCEPQHSNPWTKPWAAYVSDARDGDGQPTTLHVLPTDGSHIAESDAEWLRQVIRDARARHGAALTVRNEPEDGLEESND
jgi:hypothetical protein